MSAARVVRKSPVHLPANLSRFRSYGGRARVRTRGRSMEPTIPAGGVVLVRGSVAPPIVGEIVTLWNGRAVVVHRVKALRETDSGPECLTRGDGNSFDDEWTSTDVVFGRAELVPVIDALWTRFLRKVRRWVPRFGTPAATGFEPGELCVSELDFDSVLRPNSGVTVRDLDVELLLLREGSSEVRVLNQSARAVFLLFDAKRSLRAISDQLGREHQRDVAGDVLSIAGTLYDLGYVDAVTDDVDVARDA